MPDLTQHLIRQATFSQATFGPGHRTEGVLDHIGKEMEEVRSAVAANNLDDAVKEWTDIAILALDGLLRAVRRREQVANDERMKRARVMNQTQGLPEADLFQHFGVLPHITHDRVAQIAADSIVQKQGKNEVRYWPDWRSMPQDKAIEHERGHHD